MSTEAWDWLPEEALAAPGVLKGLDDALEDWSRRWFSTWRLLRQGVNFTGSAPEQPVVAAGSSLRIRGTAQSADKVAAGALHMDFARLELSDADQVVLQGFRDRILLDLARTVETALGGEAGAADPASGLVVFDLRDDEGRKLLLLETTRAALGRRRRSLLRPTPRPAAPLTDIGSAIAEAPVTVEARLGSAVVPLTEARKLTAGDVLVLDQPLDAPFELAGPGDTAIACATLADAASPRSLRLQAAPGRQR